MSQLKAGATEDIELTCPVCLDPFNDPVFVCVNHHTLCRECYKGIAGGADSRCPECREKLSRPVENSYMRRLIEAQERQFSAHGVEFQVHCAELLSAAAESARQSEKRQRIVTEWEGFVQGCVAHLNSKFQGRLERIIPETGFDNESKELEAALQNALDCSDLGAARSAYDGLKKASARWAEKSTSREIVAEPKKEALFSQFHERLSEVMNEAEQSYLDGVYGLIERVCSIVISCAKLKIEKKMLQIPELKCRLFFTLPGCGAQHTPYVALATCDGLNSNKEVLIPFNFQQSFDYSSCSMPNGPSALASFLRHSAIEIPVCLQLKWKEKLYPSDTSDNTLRSRLYQLVALVPLAEAITSGETIKDKEFPLLDENEQGSIKLSTNLPCLLHQVYLELPPEERTEVESKLR